MKRLLYIILPVFILSGCIRAGGDLYEGELNTLRVTALYPEGNERFLREGVTVNIKNRDLGYTYSAVTDASGIAEFEITNGIYDISLTDKAEDFIFQWSMTTKVVDADVAVTMPLVQSVAGSIIIKEIYCGGCTKSPQEGTYGFDNYMILHNNTADICYLDGLCFGKLDPYNSPVTSVWITQDTEGNAVFPDFVPIIQAIWQFGGDGTTFPLAPGEDAVIAISAAIDHSAQFPESVNLNKEGYFVCYNPVLFTHEFYHPAPGNNISPDHYIDVAIKTGVATGYSLSVTSPAIVLFKAVGTTIQEFLLEEGSVVQKPGSSYDQIVKIPVAWVSDGVEVFDGRSTGNKKRISPMIDAGYISQSDIHRGRTLHRIEDEEASAAAGFEVLMDTNNSSNDFYERSPQSLHE